MLLHFRFWQRLRERHKTLDWDVLCARGRIKFGSGQERQRI